MVPSSSPILEGLNDVQLSAVVHGDGALLILAGAGSGKTRVLTRRLAYLIAERRIDPTRVLAVTFTNKAAGEMRERVGALLGPVAHDVWMGTFHSICLRVLKRHAERLGFRSSPTVFDTDDQIRVLREILKESPEGESALKPREAQGVISSAKNRLMTPEEFEAASPAPGRQRIARVWKAYDRRLREQDGVDFDDILILALRLLTEEGPIGDLYAERFQQVLVDEYQDTNRVQFLLVRRLAEIHGNICVVGDDDQSIYGWRGADITNILEFERHFPGATILRMEQNYRSTGAILDVANAVVRRNAARKEKTLWTSNPRGEGVHLAIADDEEQEARRVATRIRECLRTGISPSDVAVLYRTHAQSRPIEDAFVRSEIPYRVIGGVSFYQRREVKDLLAYLRLLVNPRDEISFRRAALAPKRGAGETTIDRIVAEARGRGMDFLTAAEEAANWGVTGRGLPALASLATWLRALSTRIGDPPHLLLESIVQETGYREWLRKESDGDWEERFAHVVELIEGARSYEGSEDGATLAGFLEQVSLYAQADDLESGGARVTLMTVHNAKGLEYASVFVTGMEEGLFPHYSSLDDPQEMEEERRLFYVAVTRARERLTLSAGRQRRRINFTMGSDLSRFLSEIPQDLLIVEANGLGFGGGYGAGLGTRYGSGAAAGYGTGYRSAHGAGGRAGARGPGASHEQRDDDGYAGTVHPGVGEPSEPVIEREPATRSPKGLWARHVRYGVGRVVAVDGDGDAARVEVSFPVWGTKKILRAYLTFEEEGK
jgi:DNA helicase II / ATP-dependent DNA helicase PcrA